MCIYHVFIHSSVDECLNCFCMLAIVNNVRINVLQQIPLRFNDFVYFGCIPSIGIAGSYDASSLLPFFTVVVRTYVPISHVQGSSFSTSLLAWWLCLLDVCYSCWGEVISIMVLISFSFVVSDIEHVFAYFLTINSSSFKKCLFRPSVLSLNWLFLL